MAETKAHIKFRQGLKTNLDAALVSGEPGFATDTQELYIGSPVGNKKLSGASEWTFLAGQDQAVKTTSSPMFAGLTVNHAEGALSISGGAIVGSAFNDVWERKGIVIPLAEEPQIIYEGSPQLIAGTNVFKMWYSGVGGIRYAESLDGLTWTDYGAAVAPGYHSGIYKTGGVYYLYTTIGNDIDLYTSADGVTFVLDTANVLMPGGGGSWDDSMVCNPNVWKEGATWYMMYDANQGGVTPWRSGLATSADGEIWVKDGGNPVLTIPSTTVGGLDVHKVGATYYAWNHESIPLMGQLPTDGYFYSSPDLVTWTKEFNAPVLPRLTYDDGAGQHEGQIADLCLVEANGKVYCFYTSKFNQLTANIKLAIANFTFANLVALPFQGPAITINNGNVGIGRAAAPNDWAGVLPARLDIDGYNAGLTTDALRIRQALYLPHFNMIGVDYASIWKGHYDGTQFVQTLGDKMLFLMDTHDIEFRQHNPYTVLFLGGDGRVGIGTNTPHYPFTLIGMTDYANDAAAGAAGLTQGDFYTETGTNPKRVCVKT